MEPKQKTVYPEEIDQLTKSLTTTPCIYLLEIEPEYYKYGKSRDIRERLRTHYRTLNFKKIIEIYTCNSTKVMDAVEKAISDLCDNRRERVKKYKQTEIINTADVQLYINFIKMEILKCDTPKLLPRPIEPAQDNFESLKARIIILEEQVQTDRREIVMLREKLARADEELIDRIAERLAARLLKK